MKKFLSIFLCLCLMVSLMTGYAFASGEASSADEALVLTWPMPGSAMTPARPVPPPIWPAS